MQLKRAIPHCLLVIATLSVSVSCTEESNPDHSDWPPHLSTARGDFHEAKELYNGLISDLETAGYFQILLIGNDVRAASVKDMETLWEAPPELDQWRTRINALQIRRIVRSDTSWWVQKAAVSDGDGREYATYYILDEVTDWKRCRSEFREIQCGVCGEPMDARWTLRIVWYPAKFTAETATNDETNAGQECLRRGFEELGYDTTVF